jgi:hypothetical protein
MSEEPMATVGFVAAYQTELDRLLRACGFEEVKTVYGPARHGKTAEMIHQLQLASTYDHAYWEARLHSAVISAMMNAYIETGEVSVGAFAPPPAPTGYVLAIDRHRMMMHSLADAGYLVAGIDVAADRIEIHLPPSGEMGPMYDASIDRFVEIKPPLLDRAQPDYLRHDPTKNVGRRRARKAYGRKGDRP